MNCAHIQNLFNENMIRGNNQSTFPVENKYKFKNNDYYFL